MSEHEYEEFEEEVEVSGDEEQETSSGHVNVAPGKVNPSTAVKNVEISSPEREEAKKKYKLNPKSNPFDVNGVWTKQSFSEINIVVPPITHASETTNELTRDTKPEARYWKAPLSFSYSTFHKDTLRIDNVHVPYSGNVNYGDNFIYVCLPNFMGDAFAAAGKARRPTIVNEASLVPDENMWWKIVNGTGNNIGVLSKSTGKFLPKSASTIFQSTNKGITLNIIARFFVKASTNDKTPLPATAPQRVVMVIERGYIVATNVDVEPPKKVSRNKPKSEPLATQDDIATDDLMKSLASIGL